MNDPNRTMTWSLLAAMVACAFIAVFLSAQGADAADSPTREQKIAERIARRLATPDALSPPLLRWDLVGGTDHQRDVIRRCQEKLLAKGVIDTEALRYGCSIYLAENERMDPLRLGDGGHAFGLCQRNLGRASASTFLAANPGEKSVEAQLEYCTSRFASAWHRYGNVFQATVEHNSPAAAAKNRDACHISPCYFQRVKAKAAFLHPVSA